MKIYIDATRIEKDVARMQKQMPFVIRKTLTGVARNAEVAIRSEMQKVFDRPTPYTLKSIYSSGANGNRPFALVGLREFGGGRPAKYLAPEVLGGARNVKAFERAMGGRALVPTIATPLDQYGNISRGMIGKILSQLHARYDPNMNETVVSKRRKGAGSARFFVLSGSHGNLSPGIYARFGSGHGASVKAMLRFHVIPSYRKRMRLWDLAEETIAKTASAELAKAFEGAMGTAR